MDSRVVHGHHHRPEPLRLGDKTLAHMQSVTVDSGTILFQAGDLDNRLYIILAGEIELLDPYSTKENTIIAVRGPGELLGEMSVSEPLRKHRLIGRARGETQFLSLLRDEMDTLLTHEPLLAYELVQLVNNYLHRQHRRAFRILERQNQELSEAYLALEKMQTKLLVQERIQHELQLAREIQEQMLPSSLPTIENISLSAWIIPAQEVAGDFYDAFLIDQSTLAFAIGDVCGKGMPAALYMAQTRSLLRAAALQYKEPQMVLAAVNTHLCAMNRSSMFVTMVYALLDLPTRRLGLARAGHDYPLLYSQQKIHTIATPATGQPLGIVGDPIFDLQTCELVSGDRFLLYTDGIVEAANQAGEFFGQQRLQQLLLNNTTIEPAALCQHMLQAVTAFRAETPQSDDITLVMVGVG